MAGVLTFDQYVGGPDEMVIEQAFPSNQRSVVYGFDQDVSGWTFEADYQALVVDSVSFNRYTGEPNFANSSVIGYFPKVDISGANEPTVINTTDGTVKVTFPAQMYTGAVYPDARSNVVVVVFSFTWTDAQTPAQTTSHRWAFVQAWEPDVAVGNPVDEADYTAI